jgi:hypothetical protein
MGRYLACGLLGGLLLGGCGLFLGTDDLSFDETQSDDTAVTSVSNSTQASGANGGSPGTGGAPATGGTGGTPERGGLINSGLLARYHLDEAATGTPPINAEDVAPAPLPLGLRYDGIMSWAEIDGIRALDYSTAGVQGDAFANVAATSNKLWLLHGLTHATVEAVVDVAEVGATGSAIVFIGTDLSGSGEFGLFIPDAAHVSMVLGAAGGGNFDVPITTLGRVVLHGVLDGSTVTLYVDGSPATPVSTTAVPVDLGVSTHFMLGNTRTYTNTMRGRIYYAALYTAALTPDELAHNAQLLSVSDDTPQ